MKLERATAADDQALKDFYAESALHGPVDIKVYRPGSFFDQYRLQSEDHQTFVLRTDSQKIVGLATILFRQGMLNEKFQTIGYCTDLRVAPSRHAIVEWTEHFTPLLEQLSVEKNCQCFFSAIAQYQGRAYNALVRPRAVRRNIPRYYQLGRFELVSVVGRLPMAPSKLQGLTLRRAEASKDFEPLAAYLKKKTSGRLLSFDYSAEFLYHRTQSWPGLTDRNFILALDRAQNIVGCVAPWDGQQVQQFIVEKYNGFTQTLKRGLSLLSLSGYTSRLPKSDSPFNFFYLTHYYSDNPDIFYSLLYEAYELARPRKFLVYSHFLIDPKTTPPRSFISSSLPFSLYTVLPPKTELPDFLRMPKVRRAPDFDLALL